MALRGVDTLTAITVLAELGDITRFDTPRQLMAYVGLVPSEHSSGQRRQRGAMQCPRAAGPGGIGLVLSLPGPQDQAPAAPRRKDAVQAIAWKAQRRLCGRYRRLSARGMPKGKVCTAIARELLGFMWAIAWERRHPGSMIDRAAA